MYRFLFIIFIYVNLVANEDNSNLTKEKLEIIDLKKDLNNFYNQKEKEYQDRKKELEEILNKIEKEKKEIQQLHDKNLAILQDIKQTVQSKTSKIYNAMKAKNAAQIFDEMINEGKIDDVFDIILKLNEKQVTSIMKFLSIPNAAMITKMLEDFVKNNNVKE